ncbi:MAG: ABC transporter permease [Mycetocola sp.]
MKAVQLLKEIRHDRIAATSLVVAVAILLLAVFLPILSPTDPDASNLAQRFEPPIWLGGTAGLLGTDELGRDVLLRIAYGLRTSFTVGVLAVIISAVIGTTIGLIAGYFGGRVDAVLMRITDVMMAFPGLLLVMVLVLAAGRGIVPIAIILGLLMWTLYARVIRGAVLSLRSTDLVAAHAALGAGSTRVLLRHVLPNVGPTIVAIVAVEFGRVMLAEAALSFLGLGVQAPTISLGAMLSEGREYLVQQWWLATFAGLFLTVAVLAVNFIGTWLERQTDPTWARKRVTPARGARV